MFKKTGQGVGKFIRKARKSADMTQEKLAESIDLTPKHIQYIESSKRNSSLKTIYKIARALKVKAKDLIP